LARRLNNSIRTHTTNEFNLYPNTETMTTEQQELQNGILKSKIMELNSALLFTESASLLQLPTHVISDVQIDETMQLWFVIPKPAQSIEAFDKSMPAKLDFFKKGKEFFVKVKGTASLIADAAALENEGVIAEKMAERMKNESVIVVKVAILESEVVDNTPKPAQNWLKSGRMQLSSWFF